MDEQEHDNRQDIGDGEDDYMDAAQKINDAFNNSGNDSGGESKGTDADSSSNDSDAGKDADNSNSQSNDQSPGNDSGNDPKGTNTDNTPKDSNANTGADTQNPQNSGNTGANMPDAKGANPANTQMPNNAGSNTVNSMPQSAQESANTAAQQGAELGNAAVSQGTEAGATAAAKSAEAGVNAVSNAAATAVKVGTETGAAVSEVASGTAVGGPWGAVIMAVISLRHTLFKILVCICLPLILFSAILTSLPSIMFDYIRGKPAFSGVDIDIAFEELSAIVAQAVTNGYNYSLEKIHIKASNGDYDYDLSMEATINYGYMSADYDICFILAAYSASMMQQGTSTNDMLNKLEKIEEIMFPVTYEEKYRIIYIPPDTPDGNSTYEIVKYLEATIHPFDQSAILKAFNIDVSAQYGEFKITNGEAIENMANTLRKTMFGTMRSGAVPLINDMQFVEFLDNLNCSPERKELMTAALSLVGRVPYFWGGKSSAGWNETWNTPKVVTSIGSSTTGTLRPYGLDCTGFTEWVYRTALDVEIGTGSWNQWAKSTPITQDELLPGDLGFMSVPGTSASQHVLIYAGKDTNGYMLWVHCEWGYGVHISSPDYVKYYMRPNNIDLGE